MKDRLQNSTRIADILQHKLQESSNKRGNIIFNSLSGNRMANKSMSPVADPRVYSIIGKLHSKSPIACRVISPSEITQRLGNFEKQ